MEIYHIDYRNVCVKVLPHLPSQPWLFMAKPKDFKIVPNIPSPSEQLARNHNADPFKNSFYIFLLTENVVIST